MDPLSRESTPLITLAQSLYLHSAPLRVGFVFVTNYDTSITGLTDASVAANNAYHYFAETKGSEHALQFLIDVRLYGSRLFVADFSLLCVIRSIDKYTILHFS